MENKPILSICIPTYNREKYLRECLDSLFQSGANNNLIEVLISDNASTDNTFQTIQSYQEKYKNIKYVRNRENIGFDGNVLSLYQKGSGEYIWIMSDDDSVTEGCISQILDILKKNKEIGTFQFNFNFYDRTLTEFRKKMFTKESIKFDNLNELYNYHNYAFESIVYISNLIFKNDGKFQQAISIHIPMTHYIHACVNGLLFDNKCMYIKDTFINYRTENSDTNTVPNFKSVINRFKICILGFLRYIRFVKKNKAELDYGKLNHLLYIQIYGYCVILVIFFLRKLGIYEKIRKILKK